MNIHEYQGKQIFKEAGVSVPLGYPAFSVDEALEVANKIGSLPVMVKAQIHAGGRGKGGGVKLARSLDEVKKYASIMSRENSSQLMLFVHMRTLDWQMGSLKET